MTTFTKNKTVVGKSCSHIYPKAFGLANSAMGKSVQYGEINLCSNFRFNLLSLIGVITLFQHFFPIFNVFLFKNLIL